MAGLLERVRAACKAVAGRATHVRIDYDSIPSYAASLPLERIAHPQIDPDCHYLGRGDDTVAFFLTLNAVNFSSGYSPHLRKRSGMSGYFTVASSLNDHYSTHGPLSAQDLTRLSTDDCTAIFGQEPDNRIVRELLQYFATALNDLGRRKDGRTDGRRMAG